MIHPSAVFEDPAGDFHILLMNGLQPKSSTDFLVLLHLRMMADAIISSGKSLREEPDAYSFQRRVEEQALITESEYINTLRAKKLAILTRSLSMKTFAENEIYQCSIMDKIFFPTQCHLSPYELESLRDQFRV